MRQADLRKITVLVELMFQQAETNINHREKYEKHLWYQRVFV